MGHATSSGRDHWVAHTLARLSLEQQVGQLIVQYVYGADADQPDPRNLERYGVATPAEVVTKYQLGGVIYFAWSDNTADPAQVRRLSDGLQRAALAGPAGVALDISVDQETGRVARIGRPATMFPGAMALGAGGSVERTRQVFRITGVELRAMGISTDYAPDADVNVNPANPVIGIRAFGSRPAMVAEHVGAAVRGLRDGGVGAAAKHFPGHGDTGTDSHTALPVIDHTLEQWRELEKPPFVAAIEAGVDEIMSAHIAFPELDPSGDPATLSAPVLTGLLRDELGYQGLVITDSLQMAGVRARYGDGEIAVRALEAGVDLLLMPADPEAAPRAVLDAVRAGRLSAERIATSVRRVLAMKFDRGLACPPADLPDARDRALEQIGRIEHLQVADDAAAAAVTLLRDHDGLIPIGGGSVLVLGVDRSPRTALTAELAEAGINARAAECPTEVDRPAISALLAQVATVDVVVLLIADLAQRPGLNALADALADPVIEPIGRGSRLLVVGIKDAQDVTRLGGQPTVLLTFSATTVAMRGLAAVLTGGRVASGKLPVDLPVQSVAGAE